MAEETLRLAVRCPECLAHPPVRVYPREIEEKRKLDAHEPVQTVQCGRCGCVYEVRAIAYHGAA